MVCRTDYGQDEQYEKHPFCLGPKKHEWPPHLRRQIAAVKLLIWGASAAAPHLAASGVDNPD